MPWQAKTHNTGEVFHKHVCKVNTVPPEYAEQDERFDAGYGPAIDSIYWEPGGPHRKEGRQDQLPCAYITNGEYASVVSYCPWCGERLEKPE